MRVHVCFINVCISLLSASTFTTVLGGGNGQMTPVLGGQSTLEKDLLPSVLGGGCCEMFARALVGFKENDRSLCPGIQVNGV